MLILKSTVTVIPFGNYCIHAVHMQWLILSLFVVKKRANVVPETPRFGFRLHAVLARLNAVLITAKKLFTH